MSSRGARIKQALQVRQVRKQHALASALGVHESAITRWKENGSMSLENATALCQELDVSADWLLLGLGHMDQHKGRAKMPTYAELFDLLSLKIAATLIELIKLIAEGQIS